MSVPVAIISTVTAILKLGSTLNAFMTSSGFSRPILYVIFLQKSFPLPKTSLVILTISSAWLSSFAKINVFGIQVGSRSGNS